MYLPHRDISLLILFGLPSLASCGLDSLDALIKDSDSADPYVSRDTSLADTDTSGETETQDSVTDDTRDSIPDDTQDTEDTGTDLVGTLRLYPDGLVIFAGASAPLRVVFEDEDGRRRDLDPGEVSFSLADTSLGTIDSSGAFNASSAGTVGLTAEYSGLVAEASIEVRDDSILRVSLLDAGTGLPIENGSVSVGDDTRTATDTAGLAELSLADPNPVAVNAWGRGYIPVTVVGTVARELVIPLRAVDSLDPQGVDVAGDVDLSHVDPGGVDDLVVGFAAPSLQSDPLFFDVESLMGTNRSVSVYGVRVTIPSNAYILSAGEDFAASSPAGAFGIWTFAGPVPIVDLTAGFSGTMDIIELLVANLGDFSFDWAGGLSAVDGESLSQDLSPSGSLAECVVVSIPDLPDGFSGSEDSTLFVFDLASDGSHAVVGLGAGDSVATVSRAPSGIIPGSTETTVLSLAQVDGMGSGEAMSFAAGNVVAGSAEIADYLSPPAVNYFYGASHDYDLSFDADAQVAHVIMTSSSGEIRELLFAGGAQVGTLTEPSFPFSYGRTTWEVLLVETTEGTFESITSTGAFVESELRGHMSATSRMTDSFSG